MNTIVSRDQFKPKKIGENLVVSYYELYGYRNTSGSLGELEMLWEHEPQASVCTGFSSSPKLPRVFLNLVLPNLSRRKKGKQLVNFD